MKYTDPIVGRMLNPDNYLMPENTQGLNMYSYVLNNPMKYTDPTGWRPAPTMFDREGAGGAGDIAPKRHDFSGANNKASMYFRWSKLYTSGVNETQFDDYYQSGGQFAMDGNYVLSGYKALNWISEFSGSDFISNVSYDPAGNGSIFGNLNGGFSLKIPYYKLTGSYVNAHALFAPGSKVATNSGGVPHGGIMFYTEGGELLHRSGEGSKNIIYTVSADNVDALMSVVNAWKGHWAQKRPYIGGEYSNPNYFQNLANSYGSNSYDPIVINGSVLGQKNMPWYMHAAAAISIMGEGAVHGHATIPIYQQHTVVNYWKQHYTPRYFQKWW